MQEVTTMPRAARKKASTAIYHIMSHSIPEFNLFPNNADKEKFLDYLHENVLKNNCKVYGYCLMTNHYHLILDTCGYDISAFMKVLNQRYVNHIKRTYNRKGHLLAERFTSKIIDNDQYLMTVSAYVHNNPKDINGYNGREFEYPYSSMGIYLETRKDIRNLVDKEFILGSINETSKRKAIKAYTEMVIEKRDTGINKKLKQYLEEFKKEQYEYKSYRQVILRDKKPDDVIKIIAEKFGIKDISQMMHRWKRKTMDFRSVIAYTLNVFCGMNITEVCKYMNNITASCCSRLCNMGFDVISKDNTIKSSILGI
jgi:putative transposase